jgi:hypothetical protein
MLKQNMGIYMFAFGLSLDQVRTIHFVTEIFSRRLLVRTSIFGSKLHAIATTVSH